MSIAWPGLFATVVNSDCSHKDRVRLCRFQLACNECSDVLRGRVRRGPGPLEVEAAQMPADIQYLADKVQAW